MGETAKVRVTIAEVEGSTPRDAGTSMLVLPSGIDGTIGGGMLEHQAMQHARAMLRAGEAGPWRRDVLKVPLGPALGQCCGGFVRLLFEVMGRKEAAQLASLSVGARLIARQLRSGGRPVAIARPGDTQALPRAVANAVSSVLAGELLPAALLVKGRGGEPDWLIEPADRPRPILCLWGAGHVGRAIVRAADGLPIRILWIDTAADRFPDPFPVRAERVTVGTPSTFVPAAPAGAYHLVMTYSHQLDQSICEALLSRGDFAFLGLIGSATKRARFLKRLREAGLPDARLARLTCPIGIGGITSKEPAAIAIAALAQLLQEIEKAAARRPIREAAE
jgi:xanthine dehydrogenase accessory factor